MQSPHHAVALSLPARAITQSVDVWISPNASPNATPNNGRTPTWSPVPSYASISPMSMVQTPVASPSHGMQADLHRSRSSRAPARLTVVAPGAGTGINAAVYDRLQDHPDFQLNVVGQSRGPYDVYPLSWSHGAPAPNLESFAMSEVVRWVDNTDCFIFGSRGGQVVLPTLWRECGHRVPPAVVINGGCAMTLPEPCHWPENAITFMLIGGQDNFRGSMSEETYVAETKRHVPVMNGSTAILYVSEMTHMPQAPLLNAVLPHVLRTILAWKAVQQRHGEGRRRVKEEMRHILAALNKDGWSGHLMYTADDGCWEDIAFSPYIVDRQPMSRFAIPEENFYEGAPIEYTRKDELRDMLRAAAQHARPGGGAPNSQPGARFGAAVQAAVQAAHTASLHRPVPAARSDRLALPGRPFLPIPTAGEAQTLPLPRSGHSPHSTCSGMSPMVDATPISRALGLRRGRHDASPMGSYASSPSYCMVQPIY
mmetsp:Transcript_59031/g.155434  ORF Transcript_59031/g.155434 Transcript_59031/m.155434 type:complete len:482 (-) Transcript_59031:272-1717(-)